MQHLGLFNSIYGAFIILTILAVGLSYGGIFFFKRIRNYAELEIHQRTKDGMKEGSWPALIIPQVASVIILLTALFNFMDWLKIWLAPRVYIIEYIGNLIS